MLQIECGRELEIAGALSRHYYSNRIVSRDWHTASQSTCNAALSNTKCKAEQAAAKDVAAIRTDRMHRANDVGGYRTAKACKIQADRLMDISD